MATYRPGKQVGTLHELEKVESPIEKFFKAVGGFAVILIALGVLGAIIGGK